MKHKSEFSLFISLGAKTLRILNNKKYFLDPNSCFMEMWLFEKASFFSVIILLFKKKSWTDVQNPSPIKTYSFESQHYS